MHNITVGAKSEDRVLVTNETAINFLGVEGGRVLSTPHMIGFMERLCRNTALPLLASGHDTVGTEVHVRHLAAAPIGATVKFMAEITGLDDRRVHFHVEAWNGEEEIGEGTHERAIINVAKFAARLAQKRRA